MHLARLLGEQKRRPVVVLSPDKRNELAVDVVVVPCSTAARMSAWHVRLDRGEGGLDRPSAAKCEQVTTIPRDWLDPKPLGGPIARRFMLEIRDALLRALDYE